MSVDNKLVGEIAHLARLDLDEASASNFAREMAGVLALAQQMQDVDTDGIEPMAHPLHAVQPLRADVVDEIDQREQFQAIAPSVEDGLYLVPQVIE
jgi:aspartyl-tRNA(Asn)/glutamyl-tRNA(Gln) amidotransferase subunit C